MEKSLYEACDRELSASVIMQAYRDDRLEARYIEGIESLLNQDLQHQREWLYSSAYFDSHLKEGLTREDLQRWKSYHAMLPQRRILVDQYVKACLSNHFCGDDAPEILPPGVKALHQTVFIHRFEAIVQNYPNSVALVYKDKKLTYQELNSRANQLAHYLHRQGIGKGSVVATFLPREPEWIISTLAIWKAGAAFVAIDPVITGSSPHSVEEYYEKFEAVIQDSMPRAIITTSDHHYLLPSYSEDINSNNTNEPRLFCIDELQSDINQLPVTDLKNQVDREDLAYIIYTSGSTGNPKGAEITHRGLMPCLEAHRECVDLTENSIMAQYAGFDFDAWIAELLILGVGGQLVIVPSEIRLDPDRCRDYYLEHHISIVIFTPTFLNKLGDLTKFTDWKAVFIVGESFDWGLVKKLMRTQGLQVINGYGLVETTICATLENLYLPDNNVVPVISIGKPILGTEFIIKVPTNVLLEGQEEIAGVIYEEYGVNTRYRELVAENPNDIGEIWVSGISLTNGYRGEAKRSNEWRFVDESGAVWNAESSLGKRYYKTGDKARRLLDGRLVHQGRFSRVIKLNGKRIDLDGIQEKVSALDANHQINVAALGINKSQGANAVESDSVIIFIAPKTKKEEFSLEQILNAACSKDNKLGYGEIGIVWVDQLPQTNNGKINYLLLKNSWYEGSYINHADISRQPNTARPEQNLDQITQGIKSVWEAVLNMKLISIQDQFDKVGGSSIKIMSLVRGLQDIFPANKQYVDVPFVLECKTIESQANRMKLLTHPNKPIPLRPEKPAPYVVFCLPSILGDATQDYRELVSASGFDQRFLFYAFRARGLDDPILMPTTIYSMALDYALSIKKWCDDHQWVDDQNRYKPVFLLGWSSGGILAPEVANALNKYSLPALINIFDALAPFPYHHLSSDQQIKELLLLAQKLSERVLGDEIIIDFDTLKAQLTGINKRLARIAFCFDYLINSTTDETKKRILQTAKIVRLAEFNYMIRGSIPRFRLYCAEKLLLNQTIMKMNQVLHWPKKYIINPAERPITGDHFGMMIGKAAEDLSQRLSSAMAEDYALHRVRGVKEKLLNQSRYIIPDVKILSSENSQIRSLPLALEAFLCNPAKSVLLIQGESGIGKTTASEQINSVLEALNIKTIRLPLNQFKCKKLKDKLKKKIPGKEKDGLEVRVLILDGYDERIGDQDFNYFESNGLSDFRYLKVIFTCRSEVLGENYRSRFSPMNPQAFEDWKLQGFSKDQIIQLIRKNPTIVDVKACYDEIFSYAETREIIKNPLHLTFLIQGLSEIRKLKGDLNLFRIYKAFTQDCFKRGEEKVMSNEGVSQYGRPFIVRCREYCHEFALTLFSRGVSSIHCLPPANEGLYVQPNQEPTVWSILFSADKKHLMKASPISIKDNWHEFFHKSLLEFFIVEAVITLLYYSDFSPGAIQEKFKQYNISPRRLVSDISFAQFWREEFNSNVHFQEKLFLFVILTREREDLSLIGAVSITLLNLAGVVFNNRDLQGIRIPDAILDGALMDNVNFAGADLRRVSFKQTWLRSSRFSGANVDGILFGEMPWEDIDYEGMFDNIGFTPDAKRVTVKWNRGVYFDHHSYDMTKYESSPWPFLAEQLRKPNDFEKILNRLTHGPGSYSPDGCIRVIIHTDSFLEFHHTNSDKVVRVLNLDMGQSTLFSSCFSPNSKQFAFIQGKDVVLIDPFSGFLLKRLCGHTQDVYQIAFHPTKQILVTAGADKLLRFWDTRESMSSALMDYAKIKVLSSVCSIEGNVFARVVESERFQVYDVQKKEFIDIPLILSDKCIELNVAQQGNSVHKMINYVNLSQYNKENFSALALSHDGAHLYIGLTSGELFRYNRISGECRLLIAQKFNNDIPCDWFIDSSFEITANYGAAHAVKPGFSYLSVSQDNRYLAVGWVFEVYIIDLEHPDNPKLSCFNFPKASGLNYDLHQTSQDDFGFSERWMMSRTTCLQFSPNSQYLAVFKSSEDHGSIVCLYDIQKQELIKQYDVSERDEREGKKFTQGAVAFSPNNRLLVWGEEPGGVCWYDIQYDLYAEHWDANDKKHRDDIVSLAFSPDGQFLVSASRDKTIRRWAVTYGEIYDQDNAEYSSFWSEPDEHLSIMGTPLCVSFVDNHRIVIALAEGDIQQWAFVGHRWEIENLSMNRSPYLCLRGADFSSSQNLSKMNKKLVELHSDTYDSEDIGPTPIMPNNRAMVRPSVLVVGQPGFLQAFEPLGRPINVMPEGHLQNEALPNQFSNAAAMANRGLFAHDPVNEDAAENQENAQKDFRN